MSNFICDLWNEKLVNDLNDYLYSIRNADRMDWEKRVINTKNDCYAIPAQKVKSIANEIYKGNYISFLDIMPHSNHTILLISTYLISKIKDYKIQIKYINKISKYIDNWALVDSLKFNTKKYETEYLEYADKMLKSKKEFERRIGVRILFDYTKNNNYYNKIFDVLNSLEKEEAYYVNMAAAWLLCECFIKNKDLTFNYYKNNKTNSLIINKSISKCRDSFRVSKEDKDELLKYRRKDK